MLRPADFKLGYMHFGSLNNFKKILSRFSASYILFPKFVCLRIFTPNGHFKKERGVPIIHFTIFLWYIDPECKSLQSSKQ